MKVGIFLFAGLAVAMVGASPAMACVACGSPAAHHLRQALFSGNLVTIWLAVAAPFPLLLGAAVGLSRSLGGDA